MPEYSIEDTTLNPGWVKTSDPLESTSVPSEAWYTTDEQEAIDEATKLNSQTTAGRFASGPRPIPH